MGGSSVLEGNTPILTSLTLFCPKIRGPVENQNQSNKQQTHPKQTHTTRQTTETASRKNNKTHTHTHTKQTTNNKHKKKTKRRPREAGGLFSPIFFGAQTRRREDREPPPAGEAPGVAGHPLHRGVGVAAGREGQDQHAQARGLGPARAGGR